MMQHTTQANHTFPLYAGIVFIACAVAMSFALFMDVPCAHAVTAAEKQAEAEEALANLTAMQESLDRLSADYGEAVAAQEEAEKKHTAAEKRIGEITKELEGIQGRLGERARDMYRSGGVTFLEMVLGASTFEEFATSLDMVSRVNQSDADMVDTQRELKVEAVEQEKILNEQAEVAAQKAKEAAEAEQQAQATVAEMQATYDSLSAEAAQLLEEERKAREAEEAARAAAVLAAAKAKAEAEEAERKAREAEEAQRAQEAAEAEAAQQAEQQADEGVVDDGTTDGDATDDGTGNTEATTDEAADDATQAADDGANEAAEEQQQDDSAEQQPAATYEGGSDTVSRAYACLGAPYVWGGVGPEGYDCSGLVSYCLTGSHSRLGTTYTFLGWPQVSEPVPGDIAVNEGHTGVYIGDGQMIHAATYGVGVITGPVQSGMIFVRYGG